MEVSRRQARTPDMTELDRKLTLIRDFRLNLHIQ